MKISSKWPFEPNFFQHLNQKNRGVQEGPKLPSVILKQISAKNNHPDGAEVNKFKNKTVKF